MKLLVQILLFILWLGVIAMPDPYRIMVLAGIAGWQVGVWIGHIGKRIV